MAKEIVKKQGDRLFIDLSTIIENRKSKIIQQANSGVVLMYWEVGKRINEEILKNERAEYGKQIVNAVSSHLQAKYGTVFATRNLRYMMQFATQFTDAKIVTTLPSQLGWSHIRELLSLSMEAKVYYIKEVHKNLLSVRDLRYIISRKAYERQEI